MNKAADMRRTEALDRLLDIIADHLVEEYLLERAHARETADER